MTATHDSVADVFNVINSQYDNASDRELARAAAKRVLRKGTADLDVYAKRYHAAQAKRDAAMIELRGAIVAASELGMSEQAIIAECGVARNTVRVALGKNRKN